MTAPVVDAAWVAGGVLAAAGDLVAADLTVESATERLTAALDGGGRAARWTPPDLADVSRLEATLEVAWAAVTGTLAAAAGWAEAVVRLCVSDVETLAELGPVAPPGPAVVAHARLNAHRHAWRWPARVGRLAEVRVAADGADVSFEILVLDGAAAGAGADLPGLPGRVRAACVVILGADIADVDPSVVDRHDAAAVVVTPGADGSWLETAIRHLACGRPLDVAVGLAVPGAVIVADEGFLELTAAREYGYELLGQLRGEDTPAAADLVAALERLLESPFDADGRAGAELAAVVTAAAAAGLGDLTTVERHLQSAMANGGGGGGGGGGGDDEVDVDRGSEEGAAVESAPDSRRLQAEVVDPATKEVLEDRFVPGTNQVRVRIAAEVTEGVVVGDAPFASPTPGRDAALHVEVIAGDTHAKRTLKLPAVGDSKWIKPAVTVEVPARAKTFEVIIQVSFEGRVVQSAILSGPVLNADAPAPAAGKGLRLSVDASTPPAEVHRMTKADATFTIFPGLTGKPVVLTFDQGRPVESDDLEKANNGVRLVLAEAFNKPAPETLADAARSLTRLAVRGRLLHVALKQCVGELPGDDARWVQVSGFGSADLPLELVYTHPMPANEKEVPVCPSALAGTTECDASCPDRDSRDVVCPYGFWGTSKVVERRRHADKRSRARAGSERTITILAAGAAGVAAQADRVDTKASTRILDAVKAAVGAGRFQSVPNWEALPEAVKAPPTVLVLITHTEEADDDADLGANLQLGTSLQRAFVLGEEDYLNPGRLEPGPVVIAIGCDTADLDTSFTDYVTNLHEGGAELVVSAISPVPGRRVADFVEVLFAALPSYLAQPGVHRFGEVLTAVRQQTVAKGDVLGLALTASGDGDVAIQKG